MVDLTEESKMTQMLSYHCHPISPIGVSCAGILVKGHVSVRTWPKEGIVTIDLFTCGDEPLVPVVPVVEKLFAIPSGENLEKCGDVKVIEPTSMVS